MAKKEKRFKKIHSESLGFSENVMIVQDTETGVNYMFMNYGYSGGLTPLLDREGKPIITSSYEFDE